MDFKQFCIATLALSAASMVARVHSASPLSTLDALLAKGGKTDPLDSWYTRHVNQRNRSMMGPIYHPLVSNAPPDSADQILHVLSHARVLESWESAPKPYHLSRTGGS